MSSEKRQFIGTSKKGDFTEAIQLAVEEAKQALQTDFVRWTLISVTGEYGGFVVQTDLAVTISATGPSGAPEP